MENFNLENQKLNKKKMFSYLKMNLKTKKSKKLH